MTQLARQIFSFDDYVDLEDSGPVKHEFLDGHVWAMSGGSPDHAAIAGTIIGLLAQALVGKRCRVFTSDLRIRVATTGLGTYPDASVICGSVELDPEDRKGHTAINPTVVVEVLSPSTEDYDRGEKLAHYKRIASLREVMLVAHDEHRVDLWRRVGDHWTQMTFGPGDAVALDSLGCALGVDAIYFAGKSDNEARSAELALQSIATFLPGQSLDTGLVRTLIELTAKHGRLVREELDDDTRHFLDCDMAILGAPPEQFDAYDAAIAEEYREVPKLIYKFNRNRFLKHLLEVDRIFLSDLFHSRFDAAARANLRRALARGD